MSDQTSARDKLRAQTLGAKTKFVSKVVEYKGGKYELRQPSLAARRDIFARCGNPDGTIDMMTSLVWMVIYCTYVPDTDEAVYDESDFDGLMAKPTGSFVDTFGEMLSQLMNADVTTAKKN